MDNSKAGNHSHTITVNNTAEIQLIIIYSLICVLYMANALHNAVGELPSHTHMASTNTVEDHTHGINLLRNESNDYSPYATNGGDSTTANTKTQPAGSHSHNIIIGNTGSNTAHNNMMPYIICYIWQRVS